MGVFLRAIFGGLGLSDLIKYAIKFAIIVAVLGFAQQLTSFMLSKIPNLTLSGCMGHYAMAWGFIDGFRLFISIVLYGYIAKFTLSLIAHFFD